MKGFDLYLRQTHKKTERQRCCVTDEGRERNTQTDVRGGRERVMTGGFPNARFEIHWCADSFSGGSAAVLPQPRGPESTSTPLQRTETGSARSQKEIPVISFTAEQHAVCCCTATSDYLQETPVIKLSYKIKHPAVHQGSPKPTDTLQNRSCT